MSDLLVYLVIAVVAFVIGWRARAVILMAAMGTDPDKFIDMLRQVKKINDAEQRETKSGEATELFIERVNNYLYAYVKETNQFVAQGPDLKSLLAEAHKRFPGKVFFGEIDKDSPAKELA